MSGAIHRQQSVCVGEWSAEVDAELAPLIAEIWRAGWFTYLSCQEHGVTGKVWLAFLFVTDAEQFLNAITVHDRRAGSLWRRMNDWYFGMFGDHSEHVRRGALGGGDWEYHVAVSDAAFDESRTKWRRRGSPDFRFSLSVLFPRSDLPTVLVRMREFNLASVEAV